MAKRRLVRLKVQIVDLEFSFPSVEQESTSLVKDVVLKADWQTIQDKTFKIEELENELQLVNRKLQAQEDRNEAKEEDR